MEGIRITTARNSSLIRKSDANVHGVTDSGYGSRPAHYYRCGHYIVADADGPLDSPERLVLERVTAVEIIPSSQFVNGDPLHA